MPRAAADGPTGSPRVTPRRRRLEAGKCGDVAAGRWSAGNAGCPERLGRTAAAGRHGVWFTAFAALHAGLRSPVAQGVVRLAERLDDTVGLSAFRSKYADVVVCSGCVSGSGHLPPSGEAVGHHLSVSCADSRCRRGQKCGDTALNTARNRCAWACDLNRCIARSRRLVG